MQRNPLLYQDKLYEYVKKGGCNNCVFYQPPDFFLCPRDDEHLLKCVVIIDGKGEFFQFQEIKE